MKDILAAPRPTLFPYTTLFRSRVAGETAPLLFTSLGNSFWNVDPRQPTPALPLQIFTYANSAFEDWHRQADRKSTRLNSSHANISYAVFCLKTKKSILQMVCDS